MRIVVPVIAVLITAQRAVALEETSPSDAPAAAPAASSSEDSPKAKTPSKRRGGKKKGGALPRLDPKRGEKEFDRQLALAQSLQTPERCGAAYAMFLELQQQQPDHPDVLWGLGECAAVTAEYPELGDDVRRQRILDAKVAYDRYITVENRPQFLMGGEGRRDVARVRLSWINPRVAAITPSEPVAPVAAVAIPVAAPLPTAVVPAPPAAATPPPPVAAAAAPVEPSLGHAQQLAQQRNLIGALAELEALQRRFSDHLDLQEHWVLWRAAAEQCDGVLPVYEQIAERSWRAEVHLAGSECADRAKDVRAHLFAVERYIRTVKYVGDPEVFYRLAEGFATLGDRPRAGTHFQRFLEVAPATHQKRYLAERYLAESERLHTDCLTRKGIVRPRAVQVAGQWVSELQLPPNHRTIACED
ncbi:MAG: hypothetical protein Q8R16_00790 [bacterium]|nr:hypothetical protein [bacterium]